MTSRYATGSKELAELFTAVGECYRAEDAESLFHLARPLLEFAARMPAAEVLRHKLRKMAERPGDLPSLTAASTWRVAGAHGVTLFLRMILPAHYDLEDAPASRLWACATHRALELERFEAMALSETGEPTLPLERRGRERLSPGEVLTLRARRDIVVPEVESTTLVYELVGEVLYDHRLVYDRDSLRPIMGLAASRSVAQLEYSVALLRDLGHAAAMDLLCRLALEHRAHFIRWRAMQAACELAGPARSVSLLESWRADPHPEVRDFVEQEIERRKTLVIASPKAEGT